jgi:hypothetical protein
VLVNRSVRTSAPRASRLHADTPLTAVAKATESVTVDCALRGPDSRQLHAHYEDHCFLLLRLGPMCRARSGGVSRCLTPFSGQLLCIAWDQYARARAPETEPSGPPTRPETEPGPVHPATGPIANGRSASGGADKRRNTNRYVLCCGQKYVLRAQRSARLTTSQTATVR